MTLPVPTVQTNRLTLQALSNAHSRGVFELWSCPAVIKYSGPVADAQGRAIQMPPESTVDTDRLIDFWISAQTAGWGFRWAILHSRSEVFIGHVGFNSLGDCSEVAYHLHPGYWGQGLMSEALRAAIEWRRDFSPCCEFEAFIEPGNLASIALAERLGFEATETFSEGARRYRMDA
jgi:ribosomal-protein-alanine N-acetyltransferase